MNSKIFENKILHILTQAYDFKQKEEKLDHHNLINYLLSLCITVIES
jgi:hypothetical protein